MSVSHQENALAGKKSKRHGPGYVYLIRQRGSSNCKIGLSIDPESRFVQIDYSVPFDIDMIHTMLVPSMKEAEDLWHRVFKKYRKKGEWFELPEAAIELFRSCNGNHEYGLSYEIFLSNRWYWEEAIQ